MTINCATMASQGDLMPDLSHLTEEERRIIEEVMQRQKAEENKEEQVQKHYEKELEEIERQINERKESANKLIGTQDDAICQICRKTKFADGVGHKCHYCHLRSCARCGGRMQIKTKGEPPPLVPFVGNKQNVSKGVWACALCQKRQQIVGKTGRWFNKDAPRPTTSSAQSSPTTTPTNSAQPFSILSSIFGSSSESRPASQASGASQQPSQQRQQSTPSSANMPSTGASQQPPSTPQPIKQEHPRSSTDKPRPQTIRRGPSIEAAERRENRPADITGNGVAGAQATRPPRNVDATSVRREKPMARPATVNKDLKSDLKPTAQPRDSTANQVAQKPIGNASDISDKVPSNQSAQYAEKTSGQAGDGSRGRRSYATSSNIEEPPTTSVTITRSANVVQKPDVLNNHEQKVSGHRRTIDKQLAEAGQQSSSNVGHYQKKTVNHQQHTYDTPSDLTSTKMTPLVQSREEPPKHHRHRSSSSSRHEREESISNARGFQSTRPRSFDKEYMGRSFDESFILSDNGSRHYDDESGVYRSAPSHQDNQLDNAADACHKVSRVSKFTSDEKTRPSSAIDIHPEILMQQQLQQQQRAASKVETHRPSSVHHHRHHNHRHRHYHHSQGGGVGVDKRTNRVPCSSSEDDAQSTSECPSCDDFESGSMSERGLRRYLLGAQRVKNCIDKHTGEPEVCSVAKCDDTNAQFLRSIGQLPVTWQTSHDGTRMIGHLVLQRQSNASLGLKVVGGRPMSSGHLGAFLTRVKRGSIADVVGHLKPGDEVLEWNGRPLRDVSFDEVCEIINESKNEPHVELIVCRPKGGAVINQNANCLIKHKVPPLMIASQTQLSDAAPQILNTFDTISLQQRPLTSTVSPMGSMHQQATLLRDKTPVVMMASSGHYQRATSAPSHVSYNFAKSSGQIFGKIQVSLFYSTSDQHLAVTVHQAQDLPPRVDGSNRNPFFKMFLLPDRNEQSRRQSNTLANTCHPMWQQKFLYQRLVRTQLATRVVEITVWDYDQFETCHLDNEPRWYTLVDMDEDSPCRIKLRQQRLNSSSSNQSTQFDRFDERMIGRSNRLHEISVGFRTLAGSFTHSAIVRPRSCNSGYRSDSGIFEEYLKSMPPRPRTSHRNRRSDIITQRDAWASENFLTDQLPTAYRPHRLNRLAMTDAQQFSGSPAVSGERYASNLSLSHQCNLPTDLYGEEALRELDDKAQQMRTHGYQTRRQQQQQQKQQGIVNRYWNTPTEGSTTVEHGRGRKERAAEANSVRAPVPTGYQSDESETSLSIASNQSDKAAHKRFQEFQSRLEAAPEDSELYLRQQSSVSESNYTPGNGQASTVQANITSEANRKKSIMNRFIPGKAGSQNMQEMKKRLGFPRSEEVGIPFGVSPPRLTCAPQLIQQTSFESVGSNASSENSSWLPVIPPDATLGEFVSSLGPGQVVGRQVLASPCLGEIRIGICLKNGNLDVHVKRARNLVKKSGAKYNPAPYVKVYLMDGKHCVAKAKTNVAARTAEPRFDQEMLFTEPYRSRFLQISAWGDYGRMERKVFMGIALVNLDKLDLSTAIDGWYKLYHGNSLAGTNSPGRRNSGSLSVSEQPSGNGNGTVHSTDTARR